MRLLLVFLVLAALVLLIFFLWGDTFMMMFSTDGTVDWLRGFGSLAWVAGILLLMTDLVLPLPATLVMSALGFIYGTVTGGLISAGGSFLAGSAGYWICMLIGDRAAVRILGEKDFQRGRRISERPIGGWVVVLSRWLPVFPEVISCMAGLTRMPALKFHVALFSASLPLGFTYAYIGSRGVDDPWLAIGFSAGLPPVIWLIAGWLIRRMTNPGRSDV
jgi:uncharacterized membrane protein YdjX (TVP38/TMEM64 family)